MSGRQPFRLDVAGLLAVAQERLGIETTAVDRARTSLFRYDAESERLLAETDGRVNSLRARIRFAEDGTSHDGKADPETLVALRRELHVAEENNNALLLNRLHGRDAMTTAFSDAAQRLIHAGSEILDLATQTEHFTGLEVDLAAALDEAEPAGRAS